MMKSIAKNTIARLIATFIALIAGIITSVVVARDLGPTSLGHFSFVLWFFPTLILIIDPGLTSATAKFVSELEGSKQREVGNALTLLVLIIQSAIGLIVGLLLVVWSPWLAQALGQPESQPYLAMLGPALPVVMIMGVLRERLAGMQRYDLISLLSIIGTCITLVGTIVVLRLQMDVAGLVLLTIAIYIFQFLLCILFVWLYGNISFRVSFSIIPRSLLKRVLYYCGGVFIITSFDAIIFQRSETFFIAQYSSSEQIAYYGLAYNIAGVLVSTLPAALSGVLMPVFSNQVGAGANSTIQSIYATTTKYIALLCIPICLGGVAVAEALIQLMYGASYLPVVSPLQVLFFASAAGAISGPTAGLFVALGRPYLAALWGIPIAIVNIVLAYVLVPSYGAVGAALANTICQTLGAIAGISYLAYYQRYRLPFRDLFKITLAASVCAGLAYLVTQNIYGWPGLLCGVVLGAITYSAMLAAVRAFDQQEIAEIKRLLGKIRTSRPFPAKIRDGDVSI